MNQVLVYRLYRQDDLDDHGNTLAQCLAAAGAHQTGVPWFEAMPGGGFRWDQRGDTDDAFNVGGLLPATADAARKAAAAFMQAANAAAERYRNARGMNRDRLPDPFATESLRPIGARKIASRKTGRDSHWLIAWGTWLRSSPGPAAGESQVLGSTVEMRIGAQGRVLGGVSRARPWRSVAARPALEWHEAEPDGHEHHHDGAGEASEDPPLVYVSDNPGEPLVFLAPYWLIAPENLESHHSRRLWPACDYSVLPEISVEDQRGEARVWARVLAERQTMGIVAHGDGWRVRWSVADLSQFLSGRRTVTEGSYALLPGPGLYHVELEVEHMDTGAVRSTTAQIPVALPAGDKPDGRYAFVG